MKMAFRAIAVSLITTGVTWLLWTWMVVPDELRACGPPPIMWMVVLLAGIVILLRLRRRGG